jgi:hypothetical protein
MMLLAAGSAQAAGTIRDSLTFYDSSGKILAAVYGTEGSTDVFVLPKAPISSSQLNTPTIIAEPDVGSTPAYGDIVGIFWSESVGNLAISYTNGPLDDLLRSSPSARVVDETSRIDVSYLLSHYAQRRGETLIFAPGGAPGVPEPSTWTMMLLGFGGIGVAMRRTTRWPADVICAGDALRRCHCG